MAAVDPVLAAEGAMAANLPVVLVVANLDAMSLDLVPHPEGRRGDAVMVVSLDGQLVPVEGP